MKLEHIAINVPDVRAAAPWYAEHLGMSIVLAADAEPYMHFLADDDGSMVELYSRSDVAPPDYSQINAFNLHFAFRVDDIEGTRDRLLAAGCSPVDEILTTPAGDQLIFLRDPWGVPLQLVRRNKPLL